MASLLKIERAIRDLPQREIEIRTGIPQPRYSRIERGVTTPTLAEAEALGAVFGANPADLWPTQEAQAE